MKRIIAIVWALCLGVLAPACRAESITYFHSDAAGTPVMATGGFGTEIWRETYRPYGEPLRQEDDSLDNRLWFHGKPYDADTGLSYFGARYYSPALGRFMSMDPAPVDPQDLYSINRYAYGNNNPYRYVDPDGRSPYAYIGWMNAIGPDWIGAGIGATVGGVGGFFVAGPVGSFEGAMWGAQIGNGVGDVVGMMSSRAATAAGTAAGSGAAESVTAEGGDKIVYRLGTDTESASRLARKSAEAEQAGFPHGVSSTTTKPPAGTACSFASCSSLEAQGFSVKHTPTRNDPNHHTIELPKPVTPEAARAFNATLGRK